MRLVGLLTLGTQTLKTTNQIDALAIPEKRDKVSAGLCYSENVGSQSQTLKVEGLYKLTRSPSRAPNLNLMLLKLQR